tara:strand:+ start:3006 stop:3218 length:213 start_codon:yes stop_codon:yes gene_type:complete
VDKQEILLSKKLLYSYKERLENEIINRSSKLRIPPKISQEIIQNNSEINQLESILRRLEKKTSISSNEEG